MSEISPPLAAPHIKHDLHCPICKYNLRGLPRNHACPECGFKIQRFFSELELNNPEAFHRNWLVQEFDRMMERRDQLTQARAAEERQARQAELVETWAALASRLTKLLDRLEEKLDQIPPSS